MRDAPAPALDRTDPNVIHDCVDYVDASAPAADRTVTFTGVVYAPKCITIAVGQSVTWVGNFGDHPIEGGVAPGRDEDPRGAPDSPIGKLAIGDTYTAGPFVAPGDYPYYCQTHFLFGMIGVVRVITN